MRLQSCFFTCLFFGFLSAVSFGQTAAQTSVAGIEWKVPEGWKVQPQRSMRIATYTIPRVKQDSEDGECAVFFFGTGQGGDVRSNIARWIGQFEAQKSKPEESSVNVNGIRITTIRIAGDYLASGGPMMQTQSKKPNYKLFGAIVEAPQGNVFFKATGPAATMTSASKAFDALVNSIRKTSIKT